MDKRVEEFLAQNTQNSNKAAVLINAGLYNKVYMQTNPDGSFCSDGYDYPDSEYDDEKGMMVYYRKVPISVTDEEY